MQLDFDRGVLEDARASPATRRRHVLRRRLTGPQQRDEQQSGDAAHAASASTTTAPAASSAWASRRPRRCGPVAFSRPLTDDDDDDGPRGRVLLRTVQSAQRTVITSETAYIQAKHTEDTAATQGRISVENARSSVVTAENTLENNSRDNSADAKVQEAVKRDAQIAVDGAQRDLNNATLKAPVDGTVSAINGQVGEFLAAASGGTPQAPGSTVRVPDANSSSASAGGASARASVSSGGGTFISLTDVDTFQLVVPFEESDAAQVSQNQKVDVSVDAIAGLVKQGTVAAVAPAADTINGVVSYYATIVLNESDPRLKDGQTAQADVLTKTVENVLRVPGAAVRQDGGASVVNIPGPDGTPVPTPVTTGLQGDQFTEITSGLQDGQDVVLPQATVTATQGGGGPNGGGG